MASPAKPSEDPNSPDPMSTPPGREPRRWPWPGRWRQLLGELAALSIITLIISYLSLRLWRIPFGLALQYGGDELAALSHVKGVDETGWWFTNPRLGAPFGQEHYDFPHGGESLQVAMVKTLGLFSDAPAAIMNAYLLVTFVLVAISAHLVLRYLRFEVVVAGVVSVLYTFLPFHFAHLTPHIYRSGYFAAPVAALALLWLAGYDGGLVTTTGPRFRDVEVRRDRLMVVAVAIALIATTDVVAAAFAPAIAGMVGVLGVLRQRAWRTLALVMVFGAATVALVVAVNIPTLLYQEQNGPNSETVQRQLPEQEAWALKISRVVLPSPNHPIGFLAEQGRKPTISPIRSEGGQALGLIAVAGLIGAIAATLPLGAGVESFAARERSRPERGELLRSSGLMMLIILLLAVPSGLAYLASMIGFEEIRTWNRIVVYLGFFALVSAAIGLERISAWLQGRGIAPWLVSAFMIGVGVLGIYDQAPGTRFNYESRIAAWNRDADFFAAVEAELLAPGFTGGDPSESEGEGEAPMVYQLPLVPYPEPESGLLIYDHYRGYLHTDTVAWSYGAMRGRDAFHWQRELSQWPAAVGLDALAAVGFDGVYLDRAGYVDGGAAIRGEMGAPSEVEDDRQLFFALEDGATRLGGDWSSGAIDELADEILYPARPVLGTGFHATNLLDDEGGAFATDDAAFDLVIGDDSSRRVTLTVRVGTGPGGGHRVTLATADGGEVLAEGISDPGSREVRFELDVEVPSGGLPLRLTTDSPQFQLPGDARQINMQVLEIRAVGPALARLLDQHGQPIGSPGLK